MREQREERPGLPRRAGAELLGTAVLVTAGCGSIVVDAQTRALTHLGVALTFGLVIFAMIAACGHLSGAHFNPAVTVAFAVTRHFPWREVPCYIGAQLVGASIGATILRLLVGTTAQLGATVPQGSPWQALGVEILLSAVLMFVIMAVATDPRAIGQTAALAIGATVALDALWGGPISGASMNPARSFGPALLAGAWQGHWVYWLGPFLGTCLGACLYQSLRNPFFKSSTSKAAAPGTHPGLPWSLGEAEQVQERAHQGQGSQK
ncbi:MAG: MIP family channel protein [Thermogemmatispora sp.]|uniref:MIP/aquaporin family protein n=1 Tax=Thermogemmatispora sp. TaxID=1968838 RepID=UPI00262BF71B|nr:MIP family channel protein [Thermogemmatispora sp.]MBX5458769.1 MIP family channel protein [Thermogemmatispora sp.]